MGTKRDSMCVTFSKNKKKFNESSCIKRIGFGLLLYIFFYMYRDLHRLRERNHSNWMTLLRSIEMPKHTRCSRNCCEIVVEKRRGDIENRKLVVLCCVASVLVCSYNTRTHTPKRGQRHRDRVKYSVYWKKNE